MNTRKLRILHKKILGLEEINLVPTEKHILHCKTFLQEGHFDSWSYNEWNAKRINKILSIYDLEWFKNKRILVLGDGIGEIGSFFADIGADVLALEGRKLNVNLAKIRFNNLKNYEIREFDLRKDFTSFGAFDMIINFGLIEVMDKIQNLLECCSVMSNIIFVETIVCDSYNPKDKVKYERPVANSDSGLGKYGTHPSPFFIENFFKKKGFKIERYFDSDLNVFDGPCYDWSHQKNKIKAENKRRFWKFEK